MNIYLGNIKEIFVKSQPFDSPADGWGLLSLPAGRQGLTLSGALHTFLKAGTRRHRTDQRDF
jgi:hypothetical protein